MTGNPIIDFKVPLNSASGSLDGAITNVAVTLDVGTGEGANFPDPAVTGEFWVSIDAEILLCTSRAADTLTVTRAQQGTAAAAHDDGAAVELRITQEAFEDIHDNIVKGVLQGWAIHTDTGGAVLIGTLPANHFIDRVNIWILELFDAGNQVMDVGYTAAQTYIVDQFDVSGAGIHQITDDANPSAGAGVGIVSATEREINIYIDAAASSTGKVYVVVHYLVADEIP